MSNKKLCPSCRALVEIIKFLVAQVELLAERSFAEGHEDWLKNCEAYNAGKRAIKQAETK